MPDLLSPHWHMQVDTSLLAFWGLQRIEHTQVTGVDHLVLHQVDIVALDAAKRCPKDSRLRVIGDELQGVGLSGKLCCLERLENRSSVSRCRRRDDLLDRVLAVNIVSDLTSQGICRLPLCQLFCDKVFDPVKALVRD